ncbi:F174 protein, partial [Mystacornis crossleyi]|nr:F174 protein [Mystacornis crossleyi]
MRPPALPRLLAGPLLVLLLLLEAARCGEAAAPRPREATAASPRPTEAAGGAATRSSSSRSSSSRLAEVSAPPEQGQPMTQRALSVLVLASAALIVYFVIRTVR